MQSSISIITKPFFSLSTMLGCKSFQTSLIRKFNSQFSRTLFNLEKNYQKGLVLSSKYGLDSCPQQLLSTRNRSFTTKATKTDGPMVKVTFVDKDGNRKTVSGAVGTSILELAHQNDIELEGACEGSLACSTCHVIVLDEKIYKQLGEPTDEENDMLDLAFGLTATSRLGCQIKLSPELDGMELRLPSATRNMAVDGFKPKPH